MEVEQEGAKDGDVKGRIGKEKKSEEEWGMIAMDTDTKFCERNEVEVCRC